jgi:hypothetical protein
MPVTLLLPGLLVPAEIAADLARSLQAPALSTSLMRGRRMLDRNATSKTAGAAHLDWVAHEIFHREPPAPTAPYAYAELSQAPAPDRLLWHADPVHIELGRDHLFVQTLAAAPADADADALISVANEILADIDARLLRAGSAWFLQTEKDWSLATVPLAVAADQRLDRVLPTGDDARLWLRAHNAVQIQWHAHPLNEARERSGEATINGIWLHGGGRWQTLPPIRFTQVVSREAALRGAAGAASAAASPVLDAAPIDGALVIWDDAYAPQRREDWGGWLRAVSDIGNRLRSFAGITVDLVLTGRSAIRILRARRNDRLRFWQRDTLASVLAEQG